MTAGTVSTQGTELFFINPLTSEPSVFKMACPTGITGLGGAADQIDKSCLDTKVDREYHRGLSTPGQVSVPFNFIPSAQSHQDLLDLKDRGTTLAWLIGLSDGDDAPTSSSGGGFNAPALRTSAEFRGYIADVNIDIATNEIVRGTLTIQRSGRVTWNWNGPVPEDA